MIRAPYPARSVALGSGSLFTARIEVTPLAFRTTSEGTISFP